LYPAFLRGFTTTLLARCFMARYHATGVMPNPRGMLEAIARGEFDFLFFDQGQSLS
jgi:hypothetical protein